MDSGAAGNGQNGQCGDGNGATGGNDSAFAAAPIPGLQPPSHLKSLTPGNWKLWKQQWENYLVVTGLAKRDEEYEVALFLITIGPNYVETYNGFNFENQTDKKVLSKVIEKFEAQAIGEVNESYERYIFNQRDQNDNESFEEYLTSLRVLSRTCNFRNCMKDTIITDRIIAGKEKVAPGA